MTLIGSNNIFTDLDNARAFRRLNGPASLPLDHTHIYLICRRKKFLFDSVKLRCRDSIIKLRVKSGNIPENYSVNLNRINFFDKYIPNHDVNVTKLDECNVLVKCGSEEIILDPISASFASNQYISNLHDLEIIYIGKSYSNGGRRNTIDRLRSHETFSKILAQRSDQEEIVALCLSYAYKFRGINAAAESIKVSSGQRNLSEFPAADVVRLAESTLINYFKPQYNILHKNKFETPKIKAILYNDGIGIVSNFLEIHMFKLGSKLIPFANRHLIHSVPIKGDEEIMWKAAKDDLTVFDADVRQNSAHLRRR